MLCGLEVPTDFATTSCTPSASKIARIGPPAMMPVPALAARTMTLPAPIAADDVVMQGAAFAQRHADHAAPRLLGRLADRLRHLARLARAVADPALAVADDDERGKAEAPAALHHLGDAVDADQLFDELAFLAVARLAVAVAPAPFALRCVPCVPLQPPLEIEPALAGGVGQGLDPAMKQIAAAVEHDGATPAALARSAISLPTAAAAAVVGAGLEARLEHRRRGSRRPRACAPAASSMTCA